MTQKPLSGYVSVDTSQERLAKIWARVEPQLETARVPAKRRVVPWALGGGLAVAAAVALWVVSMPFLDGQQANTALPAAALPVSALKGAALETASDALNVALEDGSQLELAASTRLHIDESQSALAAPGAFEKQVSVRLSKGKVRCNVTPNPERRFVVLAQGVEVRVTGTSFSVEVSPELEHVQVQVTSGTVEVVAPGGESQARRLSKGESWSIDLRQAAATPASLQVAPAALEPPASAQTSAQAPPARERASAKPHNDAVKDRTSSEPGSARALLDRANAARRAGDIAAAARDYETLLGTYPSDGRAGLAAFELGRLRMDRLSDLKGAVSALRRAVQLAPGSAFREDAMARLVQAHASLGAKEACRTARAAYLKAYPKGVHAGAVAHKCE